MDLMKYSFLVAYLLILPVLVATGCAVIANRFHKPPEVEAVPLNPSTKNLPPASSELSLATWNVGYAGMGRESDFILDKGEQKRPLSPQLVDENLEALTSVAVKLAADVIFFQEMAKPSWNTYGRDVLESFSINLKDHQSTFGADILTRYVPLPLRVEIGNATFFKVRPESAERRGLPLEPTFAYGVFRKAYRMHVLRLGQNPRWTLINIHLSAFDSESSAVRERQLTSVLSFAETEYEMGNHVVIGGDWNLRLAETEFPHKTPEEFLFWIRDVPSDQVPKGWKWGVDPIRPTVRTANAPYEDGKNYRLIVDGFLVSPNVDIEGVETIDLNFENSDHNPVTIKVRAN